MKTREELLNQLGKPSMPIEITGYVDRIEQERVETNLVLVTNDEIHDILQAPTQTQLDCPYCHEPFIPLYSESDTSTGVIEQHKVFGVYANGRKLIGLKFPYCPFCGRKLGDE